MEAAAAKSERAVAAAAAAPKQPKKSKKRGRGQGGAPPESGLMRSHAAYSRINFLAQAAALLVGDPRTRPTSRYLGAQMSRIASRNVLRLSRQLRDSHCRRCHEAQVPGLTSTVRFDRGAGGSRRLVSRCRTCGAARRRAAARERLDDGADARAAASAAARTEKKMP